MNPSLAAEPPEVQTARDRYALTLAASWGYRPEDPATLAQAIARLRTAAAVPSDPYADRHEPYAEEHRTDARNLAAHLEAIQRRGGPGTVPLATPADPSDPQSETHNVKMSAAFPGAYLKAPDLQDRTVRVIIVECRMEKFDESNKPVLSFVGKERGLVLNKTNAAVIVDAYGDETDAWRGRPIELYPDRVMFSGRMVDAIRVRIPAAAPAQPQARPAAPPAPPPDDAASGMPFDDDIPF